MTTYSETEQAAALEHILYELLQIHLGPKPECAIYHVREFFTHYPFETVCTLMQVTDNEVLHC